MLTAHYNGSQHQKRRHRPAASHPPGGFSSYTDHKMALASVADLTRSPDGRSEEEEIDVISVGKFDDLFFSLYKDIRSTLAQSKN